jgi:hypothetical protein
MWKRLVIASASFGAGFAVLLVLIGLAVYWHHTRPKPWNTKALKATFDGIGVEDGTQYLIFYYVIENTTPSDYRIEDKSKIVLTGRLAEQKALSQDSHYVTTAYPLYIPAGQRVRVAINIPFPFRDECADALKSPISSDTSQRNHESTRPQATETIESLASRVRQKYKQCEATRDDLIVQRIAKLYPVYLEWLKPEERTKLSDDMRPGQKELKMYVQKEMGNLDGFVLFDGEKKYEVDFPRGW